MSPPNLASAQRGPSAISLLITALQVQPGIRLVAGWMLLALSALALSTLCALLLVAARTPWLGAGTGLGDLFGRALVLHVSLAVVVWFLACAAAIWTLAAAAVAGTVQWTALALAGLGLTAMVLALFLGGAQPVLANYVPVLAHPVFLGGLGLWVAGVALCGLTSARGLLRQLHEGPAWRVGALLSTLAAAVALAAGLGSLALVGRQAGFEILAWGPGHVLQFVHVILLMSVWTMLGEQLLGEPVAARRWLVGLLLLAALPLLGVPVIYLSYPVDSADFRHAFTLLMAYGCWPATALLGLQLLQRLLRSGRTVLASPHAQALMLSIVLFLLGCVLGSLIRNDTTMVPAHYHGTVGAVTLAYMALGYRLLPAFSVAPEGALRNRWQPLLYGSGLVILALALAWSGSLGVPRKTLHVDVIVQYPAYFTAMGLAGLGGLLAIGGAALFLYNVMAALRLRAGAGSASEKQRGGLWLTGVLTLALLLSLGALTKAYAPANPGGTPMTAMAQVADPRVDAAGHVAQKRNEELDQRFALGVTLLNKRQYEAAASELHRVLELAPKMPEAHVNMGYAMIGVQRYPMARDFFTSAIELNTLQLNAYYGLALALEGLKDMPGALGAMRSYVHLSKPDDPYLAKANAAIWEWEAELKAAREGARP